MKNEILKGYFSQKASERYGYVVYEDVNGDEVKLTEVCRAGVTPTSKHDDLQYVTDVVKFILASELKREFDEKMIWSTF